MKINILLITIFIIPFISTAQNQGFFLLPEVGLSVPNSDFKASKMLSKTSFQTGLHIDKKWKHIGLGMYAGFNSSGMQYDYQLPASTNSLSIERLQNINRGRLNQFLIGIGPLASFRLTEKIGIDLSSKFGFSGIFRPEFEEKIKIGTTPTEEYTLYSTNSADAGQKINPMLMSVLRIHYKVSDKMTLFLSGNFNQVWNVKHSYTFLDGGFNPEMSDEQLVSALRAAPMVTNVYKCTFNSFGITLGVGYTFGGKDKPKDDPKEKMDPPIPQYPEDGSTITPEEADSLVLKWVKETPKVEKANYNFWLYEVRNTTEKEDTLIYQTKVNRQQEFLLPKDVKLENGMTYRWKVQAIEARELKPCPGDCYSLFTKFQVGSGESVFYELLAKDVGNYLEAGDQLRVNLPKNIHMMGRVPCRIFNAQNEEVLKVENLLSDNRSAFHSTDEQGRVTLSLRGLPEGFYRLEVQDEQHRIYFLRFKIGKTIGHGKD